MVVVGDFGSDATTATLSFYEYHMLVMMVIGAFVGREAVVLVGSRCFRCGGAAVALREKWCRAVAYDSSATNFTTS